MNQRNIQVIRYRLGALGAILIGLANFIAFMPLGGQWILVVVVILVFAIPLAVAFWAESNRIARVIKANSAKAKRFSDEDYTAFEEQETLAKRLSRLEEAHDQGLVSDEEYVQTRQKILEEA